MDFLDPTTYHELHLRFPTGAAPSVFVTVAYLQAFDDDEEPSVECLFDAHGAVTVLVFSDTSIEAQQSLLSQFEAAHIPYDLHGFLDPDDPDVLHTIVWYRPDHQPNHGRCAPADASTFSCVPWTTLVQLAAKDHLDLSHLQATPAAPPTPLIPTPPRTRPRRSLRAIAAQFLKETGIGSLAPNVPWDREMLRALLTPLRDSDDVLILASRLEDVAYATKSVFAQGLAKRSALQEQLLQARCLARPFEDAEARLLIYTPTRIIHNTTWPTVGRLTVWRDIIDGIWDTFIQFAESAS